MFITISIIIPVYNGANYISDALSSVADQTFTDWECIVTDDASTDNSVEIINDFITRDKRFKLIKHDKNRGVSATRNTGLGDARGEYIAFLDQDDFYSPLAMESLLYVVQQSDADIAVGNFMLALDDIKYTKNLNIEFNTSDINISISDCPVEHFIGLSKKDKGAVWVWRRLWRKDIVKTIKFPEFHIFNEDLIFVLFSMGHTKKIATIDNVVVCHRLRDSSGSGYDFMVSESGLIAKLNCMMYIRQVFGEKYPKAFIDGLIYNLSRILLYSITLPLIQKENKITPKTASYILKHWNTDVIDTSVLSFWKRWKLWATLKMIAAHE